MTIRTFGAIGLIAVFCLNSPALAQEEPKIDFDERGLSFDLDEVEVTVGGRLHLDTVITADEFGGNETDFRRARVEVGVRLPGDLRVRADYDFAPSREGIRNLWIDYRGIDGIGIRAGQMVVPFSIEEMMESNDLLFMERALPGSLAPGFNAGGALSASPGDWSVQAGVFFDPIDGRDPSGEGTSYVGRAVYRPISERDRILHFGAAIEHRDLAAEAEPRFRSRQELSFARARLDTRRIAGATDTTGLALEGLYIDGPLLVQAQGVHRSVDTVAGSASFDGGFVQAAWLIGDARRRYSRSRGVPTAIRPEGRTGAFEIGVRASYLDLSDESIAGGEEANFGAVLNWYLNYNVRFGINVIHSDLTPDRSGSNVNEMSLQMRAQVRF